ncbi:hypothetical protein [Dyadobacter arcticus]|uniref:DUF2383 domain-containing protein n=1 Tax=Dyadobacter arcticus TaxID=1078754 RepID=A0ABX0UJM2_9BACT|nr:hypothetical protein [Dyadobacter arcticus]NIJ53112.1 hypothetical protein [Dyadobacter arcticus]
MENVKENEFIPMIRALWIEQRNRELLYLEALKKDGMGSFRRVLSQGHVSALLFQKEVKWIYDYFKCFLEDKELVDNQISSLATLQNLESLNNKEEIAGCLKCLEASTLKLYKTLRLYVEKDSEIRRVLDEHLNRISEFYEALCKLELGSRKSVNFIVLA